MRVASLAVACLVLAGCTGEPRTEYVTVPVTVTETATVTKAPEPATFWKLSTIQNNAGQQNLELRVQAYTLNSNGDKSYSGYRIASFNVKPGANSYGPESFPKCDSNMQGVKAEIWIGGEEEYEYVWGGQHCTNDAKAYTFTINQGYTMNLGFK